jgi:hypothetical protein
MNILQENHYENFMCYLQKHQPIWLVKENELALAGDDGINYFSDEKDIFKYPQFTFYPNGIFSNIYYKNPETQIFPIIRIKNGIPTKENWYVCRKGNGIDTKPLIRPIENQTISPNDLVIKDII